MTFRALALACQTRGLSVEALNDEQLIHEQWISPWVELSTDGGRRFLRMPSASAQDEHRHWTALPVALQWAEPLLDQLEQATGMGHTPLQLVYPNDKSPLGLPKSVSLIRLQNREGQYALLAYEKAALADIVLPSSDDLDTRILAETCDCQLSVDQLDLFEFRQWELSKGDVVLLYPSFTAGWRAQLKSPLHGDMMDLECAHDDLLTATVLNESAKTRSIKDITVKAVDVALSTKTILACRTGAHFDLGSALLDATAQFEYNGRVVASGEFVKVGVGFGVKVNTIHSL